MRNKKARGQFPTMLWVVRSSLPPCARGRSAVVGAGDWITQGPMFSPQVMLLGQKC